MTFCIRNNFIFGSYVPAEIEHLLPCKIEYQFKSGPFGRNYDQKPYRSLNKYCSLKSTAFQEKVPTLISVPVCKPDTFASKITINRCSFVFGSLLQAFNVPQSVKRNLVANVIRIDQ
jgi:hypothetical protein